MKSNRSKMIDISAANISDEIADILLPYQPFFMEKEHDSDSSIRYSPTGGDPLIYNIALNIVIPFLASLAAGITASALIDYFTNPKLENNDVLFELIRETIEKKRQMTSSDKEDRVSETEEIISKNTERTRIILYQRGMTTNQARKVAEKLILYLANKQVELEELFSDDFEVVNNQIVGGSTTERLTDIKRLIHINNRALQKLKEQQASFGSFHTPAHILVEIEDREAELEKLQVELKEIEAKAESHTH